MKKITEIALASTLFLSLGSALAASVNLVNGGFGEPAGNSQNFGVAVCNHGTTAFNGSVPVAVSVNGRIVSVSSASPLKAGKCEYTYLAYSDLGMQPGANYTVSVTIDPNHTVISNSNNQTTYTVTTPRVEKTAQAGAQPATADVNAQSGDFLSIIARWFSGLFSGK